MSPYADSGMSADERIEIAAQIIREGLEELARPVPQAA